MKTTWFYPMVWLAFTKGFTCFEIICCDDFSAESSAFHWDKFVEWLFGHHGLRRSVAGSIPGPKLVGLPRLAVHVCFQQWVRLFSVWKRGIPKTLALRVVTQCRWVDSLTRRLQPRRATHHWFFVALSEKGKDHLWSRWSFYLLCVARNPKPRSRTSMRVAECATAGVNTTAKTDAWHGLSIRQTFCADLLKVPVRECRADVPAFTGWFEFGECCMQNATAVERLGHKFRLFTIQMAANEAVMSSPTSCLLLDMKWVNYINLPWRWQNAVCSMCLFIGISWNSKFTKNEKRQRDSAARVCAPKCESLFSQIQLGHEKRMFLPAHKSYPPLIPCCSVGKRKRPCLSFYQVKLEFDNCASRSL